MLLLFFFESCDKFAQSHPWTSSYLLQYKLVHPSHARDGGGIKQIRTVDPVTDEALIGLGDKDGHVELRRYVHGEPGERDARHLFRRAGRVLLHEENLHDGVMTQ